MAHQTELIPTRGGPFGPDAETATWRCSCGAGSTYQYLAPPTARRGIDEHLAAMAAESEPEEEPVYRNQGGLVERRRIDGNYAAIGCMVDEDLAGYVAAALNVVAADGRAVIPRETEVAASTVLGELARRQGTPTGVRGESAWSGDTERRTTPGGPRADR